ncbi:TPA: hypothetical protein EYP70_01430 [Candidatus Bathyarchaeota archaeon]|nr:hypothetical protein [Candidatus Bathyarchaeota archaeon]
MIKEPERKIEERYPLKTLHDFLLEIHQEWGSFKTAAIIGIILSTTLMIFTAYRLVLLIRILRISGIKFIKVFNDLIFIALIFAFVIYEIYLLLKQYRFFEGWERRMSTLLNIEKELLEKAE